MKKYVCDVCQNEGSEIPSMSESTIEIGSGKQVLKLSINGPELHLCSEHIADLIIAKVWAGLRRKINPDDLKPAAVAAAVVEVAS